MQQQNTIEDDKDIRILKLKTVLGADPTDSKCIWNDINDEKILFEEVLNRVRDIENSENGFKERLYSLYNQDYDFKEFVELIIEHEQETIKW